MQLNLYEYRLTIKLTYEFLLQVQGVPIALTKVMFKLAQIKEPPR